MPKGAPVNTGASLELPVGPRQRVSEMQAKLHRWAVADLGRRFDDLFNFVCDPATLFVAFDRVAGNTGSRTPGVDGLTVADVEERVGMPGFLDDLRAQLRQGAFRPQPVRERKVPKSGGSGKLRKLGIPTVADRVVQAALKLVLEPIFEADFVPVSYGFRPMRRAHDAIAEIHQYGTQGYRWVLDADIEACFDSIDHVALMDRVRRRVKDKRVLGLVKAFLKAGVLTEVGDREDTHTGTPQGGILSPLLANIALSVLDEHLHKPWEPGGTMSTAYLRSRRRVHGLPRWRIVRYADLSPCIGCVSVVKTTTRTEKIMSVEVSPAAVLLAGFGSWLRTSGVCRGRRCAVTAIRPPRFCVLPDPADTAVQQLDSGLVTAFMVDYCRDRNTWSAKAMATSLRALLRFLHASGRHQHRWWAQFPGWPGGGCVAAPRA